MVRKAAKMESKDKMGGPLGEGYNAQHIYLSMMVFINPVVASLPEHAHLLGFGHGCYKESRGGNILNRECYSGQDRNHPHKYKIDTPLPDSYLPLKLTSDMYDAWLERVKQGIEEYDSGN